MNEEELATRIYERIAEWYNKRGRKPLQQVIDEFNAACKELAHEILSPPDQNDVDAVLDRILERGITKNDIILLDRFAKENTDPK